MKSPGITFEILKKQIMNYQETLNWLFAQLPMYQREGQAAYKANLDNTLQLDEYFRHPHKNFKTIHVAGTNGKGSVSHMLASILQQAGYKTGLASGFRADASGFRGRYSRYWRPTVSGTSRARPAVR